MEKSSPVYLIQYNLKTNQLSESKLKNMALLAFFWINDVYDTLISLWETHWVFAQQN